MHWKIVFLEKSLNTELDIYDDIYILRILNILAHFKKKFMMPLIVCIEYSERFDSTKKNNGKK